MIDGKRIEEEVAVNVNASQDLRIAERIFSEGSWEGLIMLDSVEEVCSKIRFLLTL